MEKRFNVTDEELRSLGLVITAEQLDDLFDRYAGVILSKYNGRIDADNKEYFSTTETQEYFDAHASQAQRTESAANEDETLESFNRKHIIYNKILDNSGVRD